MDKIKKYINEKKNFFEGDSFHKIKTSILYVFLSFATYIIYLYFTTSNELPSDVKEQLKRLDSTSCQLRKQQVKYDSLISSQEDLIKELDMRLDNIKEKTTIVKEYYVEQQKKADDFNHTQIDSFFDKRYNQNP